MLGDNIKRIRKERKISINKLSKLTGISLGYLSDIENNKAKNPTMDKLTTIASALDTTVNELLSTEEKLEYALDSINKIDKMARKALEYPASSDLEMQTVVKPVFDIKSSNKWFPDVIIQKTSNDAISVKFDNNIFSEGEQKEIIAFIEFKASIKKK